MVRALVILGSVWLVCGCRPPAPPVVTPRTEPAAEAPAARGPIAQPPAPAADDDAAHATWPVPAVTAPDGSPGLAFVDRQGDYHLRHAGLAMAYAITPDGAFGATGAIDATVVVWDLRRGVAVRTFTTPHTNLYAVALTPDGTQLVASGTDDTTDLWDVATGARLWSAKPGADELAFTPAGDRIIGARNGVARVWKVATGALVWSGGAHEHGPRFGEHHPAVSPDGHTSIELIGVGWHEVRMGDVVESEPTGYELRTYDLDAASQARVYPHGGGREPGVGAISPGRDRIAVRVAKRLAVLDAATGAVISETAASERDTASALAFPRDPHLLLTWDVQHGNGSLVAWNVDEHRELWRIATTYASRPQIAGGDAVVVRADGACVARRIADGAVLWRRPDCGAFGSSPTGSALLVGSGTSAFDVIDVATGQSLLPVPAAHAPHGWLAGLVTAADGRVAGVGAGREIWMWDASGGHLLPAASPVGSYPALHFLPDGRLVAVDHVGSIGGDARLLTFASDGSTLESTTPIAHHERLGSNVVFAGNRAIVEEILESGYHRIAIDATGHLQPVPLAGWHEPTGPHMAMRNLDLRRAVATRDGLHAFVTSPDGRVLGYDLRSGRAALESPAGARDVGLAMSDDGAHLVAAWGERDVAVLDGTTLHVVRTLTGAPAAPTAIALSPDGALVVAATPAGLVAWRAADGRIVAAVDFSAPREAPSALAFARDGTTLWVGTTFGNLHRFAVTR